MNKTISTHIILPFNLSKLLINRFFNINESIHFNNYIKTELNNKKNNKVISINNVEREIKRYNIIIILPSKNKLEIKNKAFFSRIIFNFCDTLYKNLRLFPKTFIKEVIKNNEKLKHNFLDEKNLLKALRLGRNSNKHLCKIKEIQFAINKNFDDIFFIKITITLIVSTTAHLDQLKHLPANFLEEIIKVINLIPLVTIFNFLSPFYLEKLIVKNNLKEKLFFNLNYVLLPKNLNLIPFEKNHIVETVTNDFYKEEQKKYDLLKYKLVYPLNLIVSNYNIKIITNSNFY